LRFHGETFSGLWFDPRRSVEGPQKQVDHQD